MDSAALRSKPYLKDWDQGHSFFLFYGFHPLNSIPCQETMGHLFFYLNKALKETITKQRHYIGETRHSCSWITKPMRIFIWHHEGFDDNVIYLCARAYFLNCFPIQDSAFNKNLLHHQICQQFCQEEDRLLEFSIWDNLISCFCFVVM